jgi:hypothetical protein
VGLFRVLFVSSLVQELAKIGFALCAKLDLDEPTLVERRFVNLARGVLKGLFIAQNMRDRRQLHGFKIKRHNDYVPH